MSHRHLREDNKTNGSKNLPVVSKCLAIVLVSKSQVNSKDGFSHENDDADDTVVDVTNGNVIVQSSEVQRALSPNGYNGKELLHDFKLRNKACYWNPSLVESIKCLEYKGLVEPSTILVTGADIHLENLRSAWGRRVLKAPAGFDIERIGDVNGIQMQVIPQTQFMPLPDALCSIVMDLNTQQVMATWDVISEKLAVWYKDMTLPDTQLIFDTLSSLIRDRKVFHTGSGYFVVTSDTNRLPNGNASYLPTNASWLPYHPMYVPVFQGQVGPHQSTIMPPSRSHMRSISCQVTTIEETDESEEEETKVKVRSSGLTRESRSQSLKRNRTSKNNEAVKVEKVDADHGALHRSSSLKHRSEKGKAKKDPSPEPLPRKIEGKKSKGDKPSLFSKIFGRNKKKSTEPTASTLMPPPPPPPPIRSRIPFSSAKSDASSEGREGKEKEYATFSAQFPPPEWTWYQQQLDKQKRVENWVSQHGPVNASKPHLPSKNLAHPHTGSHAYGINNFSHHNQQTRKSLMSLHNQHNEYLPMSVVGKLNNKGQWHNANHQPYQGEPVQPQSIRPDNFYESFRNPSAPSHHRKARAKEHTKEDPTKQQRSHPHSSHYNLEKRQSVYDFIDQADITPLQISNVYNSVSALSPVGHLSDESTAYAKLTERSDMGPLHSTPCYPASHLRSKTERMSHGVDGHEARDRIYGPPSDQLRRKSHRSRRKGHRAYSYYGHGDDISYEYQGRLPNKNSSRAQSRDSGVNCVGLNGTNLGKRKGGHVYENTPSGNNKGHHPHHRVKNSNPPQTVDSRVRFDVNDTVSNTTTCNMNEVTDPAFNSVVYGMSSMVDPSGLGELGGHQSIPNDSEMANTVSEYSQLPPPYPSLQSAFYEDNSLSLAQQSTNLVTCEVEINPQAPTQTQELACETEVIDVVNLPDVREVAGSSDEAIVAVSDKVNAMSVSDSFEYCEKKKNIVIGDTMKLNEKLGEELNENLGDAHLDSTADSQATGSENRSQKLNEKNGSNQLLKTDIVVADSGFSSPRNMDDPHGQVSSQSHDSEHSGTHSQTENSDGHQHSEENAVSDSHQTHSDVNMASSEHNSGSTNENPDLSAEDSSTGKHFPIHHKIKTTGSSHSLKSASSNSSKNSHNQQLFHRTPYSSSAKIITHPDVYNNNAISFSRQDHHPSSLSIHSDLSGSHQRLDTRRYKRDKHRMDIVSLPSSVSDQLHQFEEEQLSKKFGANGEFEVMGVL